MHVVTETKENTSGRNENFKAISHIFMIKLTQIKRKK